METKTNGTTTREIISVLQTLVREGYSHGLVYRVARAVTLHDELVEALKLAYATNLLPTKIDVIIKEALAKTEAV